MNRNITRIAVISLSVIIFVLFVLLIDNSSISRFKTVSISKSKYNEIISTRKKSKKSLLKTLKFNDHKLIYDENGNTYYYSMVKNESKRQTPDIKYESYSSNVSIGIVSKKLEPTKEVKMIVYTNSEYYEYKLVSTTLPLLNIDFEEEIESLNAEIKTPMQLYLFDNRKDSVKRETVSDGYIHVRGSSTANYDKKGYKLSLTQESLGEHIRNDGVSLLGMRQDDDWILYAAYTEDEKVRNVFSAKLWYESCAKNNIFGIVNGMEYKYVELFLNGQYWGLYALGFPIDEKQLQLSKDDYGNYDEFAFKKVRWNAVEVDAINNDSINMFGYSFMNDTSNYVDGLKALHDYYRTILSTKSIDELYAASDIKTAIDYSLFINLIQGVDHVNQDEPLLKNLVISFKKKGNKYIAVYTPWDMDYSWGAGFDIDANLSTITYSVSARENFISKLNPVYQLQELGDVKINKMIVERYDYLRKHNWSYEYMNKLIDKYEDNIYNSGAYDRDMIRWPEANYSKNNVKLDSFRKYVKERLRYMDLYIDSLR